MWVIGPYILDSEVEHVVKTTRYYRIAAGMTYRISAAGTLIHYLRSLYTNDDCIPSASWNLDLLQYPHNDGVQNSQGSINSKRFGVMLLSTIQQLCKMTSSNTDLFLQADYTSRSFIWLITIGFYYTSQHLKHQSDTERTASDKHPLCFAHKEELPDEFHNLINTGELSYLTTASPNGSNI